MNTKILLLSLLLMIPYSGYAHAGSTFMVTGHEYVDLGLPSGTLWAASNIGSDTPYDPGVCFSWGEIEPRESFRLNNYIFFEGEADPGDGLLNCQLTDIGVNICGTEYDAAHVRWGDGWRLPSAEEFNELLTYCQTDFLTEYLACGVKVCGPNGNSLFLPVNVYDNNEFSQSVLTGYYWSGSLAEDISNANGTAAMSLYFCNAELQSKNSIRYQGLSIRPVISRKDVEAAVQSFTESETGIAYAGGNLYVKGLDDDCKVVVADLSGRIVGNLFVNEGKCELSELHIGVYIVNIVKGGCVVFTHKINVK